MDLWPQWRSALVWDVFAVGTYLTVSLIFWYVGLMPDLATMRDRANRKRGRSSSTASSRSAGAVRRDIGSDFTWPICCSPDSRRRWCSRCTALSRLDFAIAIVPGWHSTIFPPYFVAGAIFSGFAMVLTLAIPIRKFYRPRGFHHHPPSRELRQNHARDRPDGRARLHHRRLHVVVQRRQVRDLYDAEPHVRPVRAGLLAADLLQRHRPAGLWFKQIRTNPCGALRHRAAGECRDVDGALRHRHHESASRFHAVGVGHFPRHALGLDDVDRLLRSFRDPVLSIPARAAGDLDQRDARSRVTKNRRSRPR